MGEVLTHKAISTINKWQVESVVQQTEKILKSWYTPKHQARAGLGPNIQSQKKLVLTTIKKSEREYSHIIGARPAMDDGNLDILSPANYVDLNW